ncbi:MAG: 16S rRNA (cytidine(1402)-2'-O)-methyltransferase [Synechococcus sp.]
MPVTPATLYLVATPIGNLEDISRRSLRILDEVDCIAAEDTRHSGQLLKHFDISTPQMSYHTHNIARRTPELVERLANGETIALITDAGMPGISDPGVELVQACAAANIAVVPIPGPTAIICALVASGLPTQRFVFEGFLPTVKKERREVLQLISKEARTVVFYEAPHRLVRTLNELLEHVEETREIVLARELTKRYEEFWRGTVAGALEEFQVRSPKGEFTIVLAGLDSREEVVSDEALLTQLRRLMGDGLSRSRAAKQLAKETGGDRKRIYQLSLKADDDTAVASDPTPSGESNPV